MTTLADIPPDDPANSAAYRREAYRLSNILLAIYLKRHKTVMEHILKHVRRDVVIGAAGDRWHLDRN